MVSKSAEKVKVVSGKYTGIVARIEERDVRKGTATVLLRYNGEVLEKSISLDALCEYEPE